MSDVVLVLLAMPGMSLLDVLLVVFSVVLPVVAGVFMSLFVLFVMLPVPVAPVIEPAFGAVPLMSVDDADDAIDVLVVSLLLSLPLRWSRSERQPESDTASVNKAMRVNLVLLLVIRFLHGACDYGERENVSGFRSWWWLQSSPWSPSSRWRCSS